MIAAAVDGPHRPLEPLPPMGVLPLSLSSPPPDQENPKDFGCVPVV